MKQRSNRIALSVAAVAAWLGCAPLALGVEPGRGHKPEAIPERELNPHATWLREANWGVFAHYLAHTASTQVSEEMTGDIWNKKVNSFQVRKLGKQLSELEVPYFFITIGQGGGYFCAPNKAHEKYFGNSDGRLSQRDLIADLAADLADCARPSRPASCRGSMRIRTKPGIASIGAT